MLILAVLAAILSGSTHTHTRTRTRTRAHAHAHAHAHRHPDTLPIVGIAVHSGQMLAMPARSAPGPYNYNQPCAGTQPCTGGNHGNGMAQLSIHGTADTVIPYHGGPRFKSMLHTSLSL